jgi:hypothetical protein
MLDDCGRHNQESKREIERENTVSMAASLRRGCSCGSEEGLHRELEGEEER